MNGIKIGIIGLGFVGYSLFCAFEEKQVDIVGFDINQERVNDLSINHQSTISTDSSCLKDCNFFIIAVQTLVNDQNKPNLFPLFKSISTVSKYLKINDIVVFESTLCPGTTDQILIPFLENQSNMKCNVDFYVGYSPERINPGDTEHSINKVTKVVSASSPDAIGIIDSVYKSIVECGTFKATSIVVAESCKMLENIQRDVLIALMNEFYVYFQQSFSSFNFRDVLDASFTKWNFARVNPGLVGGNCIPIVPLYLIDSNPDMFPLISLSRSINESMPQYLIDQLLFPQLDQSNINNYKSVLVVGYSFKPNCPDTRNTKVDSVIHQLFKRFINSIEVVDVFDPLVSILNDALVVNQKVKLLNDCTMLKTNYDIILILVKHDWFIVNNLPIHDTLMMKQKYGSSLCIVVSFF